MEHFERPLSRRQLLQYGAGGLAAASLGPLLAARPDLVLSVPVDGANPDVDTPADLAALGLAGPLGPEALR